MANPPCMSGDGRPAVFVGTMLQTGDTVALCDECLVPWGAALLGAMTGLDMEPFLLAASEPEEPAEPVAVDPPPDPTLAELRAETKSPARARNGRMSAGSPGPGTESDPGADGPATTSDATSSAA